MSRLFATGKQVGAEGKARRHRAEPGVPLYDALAAVSVGAGLLSDVLYDIEASSESERFNGTCLADLRHALAELSRQVARCWRPLVGMLAVSLVAPERTEHAA